VVIPIVIYCLSYIPFLRAEGNGSWLSRIWKNQTDMLSYHSGLVNDKHDFRSQWIEWPLMLRPMWYYGSNNYSGLADGVKSTIACFGNPLIWYTGLVATIGGAVSLRKIRKELRNSALTDSETMELVRKRKTLLFTFVGLLTSYLPWVLVARSTFIYHYFASLPFIMIFIAYYVKELLDKKGKKGFNIVMVSMLAVLVVSILLYPIWSGLPVNLSFIESMKWFGTWYF
jgi:dolichyl-phosphate-mannose--protein O-mannosyl transferase